MPRLTGRKADTRKASASVDSGSLRPGRLSLRFRLTKGAGCRGQIASTGAALHKSGFAAQSSPSPW